MIDVKQAVASAKTYASQLFQEEKILGLELEEVELSEDNKYWFVTLGFLVPKPSLGIADIFAPMVANRKYKLFKIDADNGIVLSMKIREVKRE